MVNKMDVLTIVATIVGIISIILLWIVITYNNYQNYIIRINEVETKIDSVLRKKFDLVTKCIEIIETYAGTNILEEVTNLKNAKISNFDLDRKLTEAIIKFESFKDKYEDLETNEIFIKTNIQINETNIDLEACKNYYNNIVTSYNKKVKQFPSDVIAKISKFKFFKYNTSPLQLIPPPISLYSFPECIKIFPLSCPNNVATPF